MSSFNTFVIFAEMRTGSNFLEKNLQQFEGLNCYGEAFNPVFIGYPNTDNILGIKQETRDADPKTLLREIKNDPSGLSGFRYFHDHDPRVFDYVVEDPKCAKIVLTRNPIDSYVSWKIASATGQWKLTDAKARKDAKATFDVDEFSDHMAALQAFQIKLLNRLQVTGQTAFFVAYEDLQDVGVMNGIAQYLGISDQLDALDKSLKKQNPSPISEKVSNFEDMRAALVDLDAFNLTRTPNFEPRRGPAVPTWITGHDAPLLFMPVRGQLDEAVEQWLADLDGVACDKLGRKRSQNDLRDWLRDSEGHQSFTIVRHPLIRAHHAFCHRILNFDEGAFPMIRQKLKNRYNLTLPESADDSSYSKVAHRAAFVGFLDFIKANLAEQTSVRIDPSWASQSRVISGISDFLLPDRILREDRLSEDLPTLAKSVGYTDPPAFNGVKEIGRYRLADIYDSEIESRARAAYARDYLMFGFKDWA
ncbi:MAG: sulfotransferase family 2 domain-containing protein [Paracoccaceae bacterium]